MENKFIRDEERQEDYFGSVLAVFFPPTLMTIKLPLWSKLSSSIICVSCNNFLLSLPVSNMVSSYNLFPTQQLEQTFKVSVRTCHPRNSLAVQGLGLHTFTTEGVSSISGQGTKIPHAVLHGGGKKFYYWLHLMSYPLSAVRKRKLEDDWNGAYGGNLKILSRTLTEL